MLGVIELLHVPARFASDQPALASLALRDAATALRALGEHDGASDLLQQLPAIDPARPAPEPRPQSTHVTAPAIYKQIPAAPNNTSAGSPTDTRNTNRP